MTLLSQLLPRGRNNRLRMLSICLMTVVKKCLLDAFTRDFKSQAVAKTSRHVVTLKEEFLWSMCHEW